MWGEKCPEHSLEEGFSIAKPVVEGQPCRENFNKILGNQENESLWKKLCE